MTKMRVVFGSLSLLCLALVGMGTCHGEGDRQTLHQTKGAGVFIAKNAEKPAVKQAGVDVVENTTILEETVGIAEKPKPYSPAASAQAREQAKEEHAKPPEFLSWISETVSPIAPWAAPVLLGAWGLIERLGKRKTQKKLVATYEGVERVKKAASNGGILNVNTIKEILGTVAAAHNVYGDIKKELKVLKQKGEVSDSKKTPDLFSSTTPLGAVPPGAPPASPPAGGPL